MRKIAIVGTQHKDGLDFYKKKNLLKEVDGESSIEQIFREISDIIDLIEG